MFAQLDHLEPPFRLIGEILYGSGLRLMEALAIRIKDVDLAVEPRSRVSPTRYDLPEMSLHLRLPTRNVVHTFTYGGAM